MGKRRFRRGAPANYSGTPQDDLAKLNRILHSSRGGYSTRSYLLANQRLVRKLKPRITWDEVVKIGGEMMNLYDLNKANVKDTEMSDIQYIPKPLIHQAALALFDCSAPVESVRCAVERAWCISSLLFRVLAGDQTHEIFRYCQFKPPAELGQTFPVWRGTRGVSLEVARAGDSWTTNPIIAATWAEHIGERDDNPVSGKTLVVRREIHASSVLFYSDHHEMSEVVINAPPDGEVDGTPDEWRAAALSYAINTTVRGGVEGMYLGAYA